MYSYVHSFSSTWQSTRVFYVITGEKKQWWTFDYMQLCSPEDDRAAAERKTGTDTFLRRVVKHFLLSLLHADVCLGNQQLLKDPITPRIFLSCNRHVIVEQDQPWHVLRIIVSNVCLSARCLSWEHVTGSITRAMQRMQPLGRFCASATRNRVGTLDIKDSRRHVD